MNEFSGLSRRSFLRQTAVISGTFIGLPFLNAFSPTQAAAPETKPPTKPRPVILDTDIGDDIDDTWALGLVLKCPELDLKLVVGDYGKAAYRSKLLAKFLQTVGRGNVPIGVGLDIDPRGDGPQAAWVKDYQIKSYPGPVHADGVQAMIDVIMNSPEPITLISVGPMPNVAAALKKEPRIANRAVFSGMYGSVRLGYGGSEKISAEWNVKAAPQACQQAFTAPWEMTITPLDTCGLVTLEGERYQRIKNSRDPVSIAIIENYRLWSQNNKQNDAAEHRSSVLFDTVAVYLAFRNDLCKMERLGIRVSDDGFTHIDEQAKRMNVATQWKSLDGFRDFLVERLAG